jgi:GNAT superfamily N-acetyltransferase
MNPAERLEIGTYAARDDTEALELERSCVQGGRYGLGYRRPTFRRRAESFPKWTLITGRVGGRLVAIAGVAAKPAVLFGDPATVAVGFDLRVHPDYRGLGIGERMAGLAAAWGRERADLVYSWVAAENRASTIVMERVRGVPCALYRHLVYPVYRGLVPGRPARRAGYEEVHHTHVRFAGPFDLYCNPRDAGWSAGHVGSWIVRQGTDVAACSVLDNSSVLAEVVERLPTALRLLGAASNRWIGGGRLLPHIPRQGETLRSWYLHDAVATCPAAGRDLLRHVARQARDGGIDFLHLVYPPSQEGWVCEARKDVPRPFAPLLEFGMWGAGPAISRRPLRTAYIDVREL